MKVCFYITYNIYTENDPPEDVETCFHCDKYNTLFEASHPSLNSYGEEKQSVFSMPKPLRLTESEPILKKLERRELRLIQEDHYPLKDLDNTQNETVRMLLEENAESNIFLFYFYLLFSP